MESTILSEENSMRKGSLWLRDELKRHKFSISNKFAFEFSSEVIKNFRKSSYPKPPRNLKHCQSDLKSEVDMSTSESFEEGSEGSLEAGSPRRQKKSLIEYPELSSAKCRKVMDLCLDFEEYLRTSALPVEVFGTVRRAHHLILAKIAQNEPHFEASSPELLALVVALTASEMSRLDSAILQAFCNGGVDSRTNKLEKLKKTRIFLVLRGLLKDTKGPSAP